MKKRKIVRSRRRKVHTKTRTRASILEASTLGIQPEHIVSVMVSSSSTPLESDASASPAVSLPPPNLPIEPEDDGRVRGDFFRRSLVSPRTSFWLGVGFGMFVVGTLMALTWQLFKVELVRAVVLGLTRTQ